MCSPRRKSPATVRTVYLEAMEAGLQSDQEGFQVDDEEESGHRIPLPNGKEDGDEGRDVVKKEGSRDISVEGGHPASEGGPKAHGLHDFVHPGEANSVVGMKEVQAQEIPRLLVAV